MILGNQQKQRQNNLRLGVEVLRDCNLAYLTDDQRAEFKELLWNHGVVVVRQQRLTALELEEFARKTFGNLELAAKKMSKSLDPDINPDLQSQYVSIFGNPKSLAKETIGEITHEWHHDKERIPRIKELDMNALYVVMLYALEVPPEGIDGQPHTTKFLDMVEAYNNLDQQQQKQLEQIFINHTQLILHKHTQGVDVPKKVHPLVSTHKVTGKKGFYLCSRLDAIMGTAIPIGMENNPGEAKRFLLSLIQTIVARTSIYSHIWQPGDVVFWDNSQIMHRGTPYDTTKYKRVALRLGVIDDSCLKKYG